MAYEDDESDYTPPTYDEDNLQSVEAPSWAEDVAPSQDEAVAPSRDESVAPSQNEGDYAGATEAVAQYQPEAEDESIPENARWRSGQLADAEPPPWAKDLKEVDAPPWAANLKDADAPPWAANLKDADAPPWAKNVEPDTSIGGTIWRGVKHSLGGAGGVVAGAAAGAAAGTPLGVPGMIGGAIIGGIAGGMAGDVAQRTVEDKFGIGEDPAQVAADQRAHPYIKAAAETAPYAATMGVGAVPAVVRAAGVGIMGAVDVAQQAYQKGGFSDIDPLEVGIRAAPGAMGGFNRAAMKVAEPIAQTVGRAVGASEGKIGETVAGLAANAGRPSEKPATPAMEDAKTVPEATRTQGVAAEQTPGKPGDPTEAGSGYQVVRDGPGPRNQSKDAVPSGQQPEWTYASPDVEATLKEQIGAKEEPAGQRQQVPSPEPAPAPAAREPAPAARAPEPEPAPAARAPEEMSRAGPETPRMTVGDQLKAQRREQLDAMQRQGRQGQELEQGPKPWRQELVERGMKPEDVKRMTPAEVERAYYNEPATQYAQQIGSRFQPPNKPAAEHPGATERTKKIADDILGEKSPETAEPPARFSEDFTPKAGVAGYVQRLLMPGSMSEPGKLADIAKRRAQGRAQQAYDRRMAAIEPRLNRIMNEMSGDRQRMLTNRAQGGDHFPDYQPTKAEQEVIDALHNNYADARKELEKMPEHEQMRFWDKDRYLPGMYKDPEAAANFFQGWFGKGSKGFTKEKRFPTDEDARNAGLEPISPNPLVQHAQYMENIKHHTATSNMIEALRQDGLWKYATPNTAPKNWARVEAFADANGRGAYAPMDVAATINHFYGQGLRGPTARPIYDAARMAQNMYTQAELGMSLYHGTTETGESIGSGLAQAVTRFASGDPKGAINAFIKAPINPVIKAMEGDRYMKLWKQDPSKWTGEDKRVMTALMDSNIKPIGIQHSPDYVTAYKGGSFVDSWLNGSFKKEAEAALKEIVGEKNWKAGLMFPVNMAGRLMQTLVHPLFQWYIPRLKLAAHADMIKDYLKYNPAATDHELQYVSNRIGNSVDNRFGEMVGDNLTMAAGLKHASYLAMRSFSFTIGGAIREIMGGTRSLAAGALQGQNRLSMKSPNYDPRTAYAIAFPFTAAFAGGIYTYLRSGQPPQDWRDFLYPRTGGTARSGGADVPERVLFPGYHKDLVAYGEHPVKEVTNKVAGIWSNLFQALTGRDYKGTPFVDPNGSWTDSLARRVGHFMHGAVPISFKQWEKELPKKTNITTFERALGLQSPGRWILNPKAEHEAHVKEYEKGEYGRAEQKTKPLKKNY